MHVFILPVRIFIFSHGSNDFYDDAKEAMGFKKQKMTFSSTTMPCYK